MPFGSKQGPGICHSFNDHARGELDRTSTCVDAFHISDRTFQGHMESVKALLGRGHLHGVERSLSECCWCHIGFEISKHGSPPDPAKGAASKNWPEETDLADVSSLLKFVNYSQEFIPISLQLLGL